MSAEETPISNLHTSLLERIKNPIAGTFIIAWLLTNWRIPIVIVFGSIPEQDRIALINQIFNDEYPKILLYTLLLPAIFTAIYLFAMPWLKEIYTSWLNRSEYRTIRNRQRLEEDLREEHEYRETLRSICGVLKKELSESEKTLQEICDFAKDGQKDNMGSFYSQIDKLASSRHMELNKVNKHIENFFNQYRGELPEVYQFFLLKWVRRLSVLAHLDVK